MCMNLYRHIDRSKVQFDFLVYHPEEGSYDAEIKSMGGRLFRIPHPKSLAAHIKGAKEFFRNHPEYRIVHNHMQSNGALICREAHNAGVPAIIYHSHFGPSPLLEDSVRKTIRRVARYFLNRYALRYYTDFLACGDVAAKTIPEKYRARIIKNAIDLSKFMFSETVRAQVRNEMKCGNKLIIGNVARFDQNKNQKFAVDVVQEIVKRGAKIELWLIGDGDLRTEVEAYVRGRELEDYVRFLGVRNDVEQLLQAMDVFLFPSIAEGLPVACIEAQAAGLPCVFSDGFDMETAITDNCRILSLDEPLEKWVETVLCATNKEREDTSEAIIKAGYDIKDTAKMMECFYLSKISEIV